MFLIYRPDEIKFTATINMVATKTTVENRGISHIFSSLGLFRWMVFPFFWILQQVFRFRKLLILVTKRPKLFPFPFQSCDQNYGKHSIIKRGSSGQEVAVASGSLLFYLVAKYDHLKPRNGAEQESSTMFR
jgi:hypothetical protein